MPREPAYIPGPVTLQGIIFTFEGRPCSSFKSLHMDRCGGTGVIGWRFLYRYSAWEPTVVAVCSKHGMTRSMVAWSANPEVVGVVEQILRRHANRAERSRIGLIKGAAEELLAACEAAHARHRIEYHAGVPDPRCTLCRQLDLAIRSARRTDT